MDKMLKLIKKTERASSTETEINLERVILSAVTFLNTKNRFVLIGDMI